MKNKILVTVLVIFAVASVVGIASIIFDNIMLNNYSADSMRNRADKIIISGEKAQGWVFKDIKDAANEGRLVMTYEHIMLQEQINESTIKKLFDLGYVVEENYLAIRISWK